MGLGITTVAQLDALEMEAMLSLGVKRLHARAMCSELAEIRKTKSAPK